MTHEHARELVAWLSGTITNISQCAQVSLPFHTVEPEARKPVPPYLEEDRRRGLRSVCQHDAQFCGTPHRGSASNGSV